MHKLGMSAIRLIAFMLERRLISGRVREDEIIQPVTAETVPRPRYTSEKINSPALLQCP